MRYQGRITNWKDDQGFGFITPNGGGKQVFVHIKSFANRQRRPVGNELVTYELQTNADGRTQAGSVAFAGELAPSETGHSNGPLIFAAAFLTFVSGEVFTERLPFSVLNLYIIASSVSFVAYALDKSAAKNNRWRTQEITLHLFAVVGGWPGALAAQRLLRHKSKKQSFQTVFWATVVLNCFGLGWLLSSSGAKVLRSILGAI